MNTETRNCQNCKSEFVIEPDDFGFYEKIKVPPPTFCPECRLRRRLVLMNERTFYKRNCDMCGQEKISVFPSDSKHKVYCSKCWWSDKWNPKSYGKDYDFSRPFFEQLKELFDIMPKSTLETVEPSLVNSEYCNIGSYLKNCYLLFNSDYSEDCMYSTYLERSKMTLDIYMGDMLERCYEGHNLYKDSNVCFSGNCNECINVYFSENLIGCTDCLGCVNLRKKQYYIFNKPYSREDYFEEFKKYDLGSFRVIDEIREKVRELELRNPKKHMEGLHNNNATGNYIFNSKNTFNSYEVGGGEDCKYCHYLMIVPTKDAYDYTMWGGGAERIYECMGTGGGQYSAKFCYECWASGTHDLEYCWWLLTANANLFGCVGLRNAEYCILNKQYTKEEYETLVPKIKKQMDDLPYLDSRGRVYKYGEFFPMNFTPYAYNETIAQEYMPLTKEEAMQQGFGWKDSDLKEHKVTLRAVDLRDNIREITDDILKETIECAHAGKCNEQCTAAFRIIPQELEFYRQINVPLPRLCVNCRHYQRLGDRKPGELYHRTCQCFGEVSSNGIYQNTVEHQHGGKPCPNEFETSYAPDRPEIVYCETCYNAEIV